MVRVVLLFGLVAACSGLGLHRQPGGTEAVDLAEEKAAEARQKALAASEEALKEIGSSMSAEQLAARDRRAAAESKSEFVKHEKLQGLVDTMEHQVGLEDKVVGRLVHQSELVRDHKYDKRTAQLNHKFDMQEKQAAKELADADAQDAKYMREAEKSFNNYETQVRHDKAMAAKEMHEVEKKYQSARAHAKTELKKVQEAETETAQRLWSEAEALRQEADNGTLAEDDVLSLLDLSKADLESLTKQMMLASEKNDTGAWFEARLDNLRQRSTTASAHMVETVKYKAAEFVNVHKDYNDHQFAALLARLLNETKSEVRTLLESNQGISVRLQNFQQMNVENMTSALALALDGVMANIEFKNHILQGDTSRLAHASEAEACEALSAILATNMQPAYKSIGHMKESLDNITKVMSTIVGNKQHAAEMMEKRTHNLLNMAYMQQLAYKEGANTLMTQVAPVILNRMQCAFSAASGLAGLGRAATAIAFAIGWLVQ